MNGFVIAADVGTSSLKAAAVDTRGRVLAAARHAYPTTVSPAGWSEQAPAHWLEALRLALADLSDRTAIVLAEAIVFTGQMSAALIVDGANAPLHPCIIWSDQRAEAEAAAAADAAGADALYALTGNPATATYSAPKLAWLKRHAPEAFAKARAFLQPKDWLAAQLTGRQATDLSDASCTNLLDLRRGAWNPSLFEAHGLPPALAPEILPSTAITGTIRAAAAAALGLRAGLPVVAGGGDGPMTAMGTGIMADGEGYASLGTSAWVSFATAAPAMNAQSRLATFAHVLPGLFVETGSMQAAGACLEWAGRLLGLKASEVASQALAMPAPSGAAPFFLPYLQGERTPYWSATSAGTLFGLNMDHGHDALVAAVLEGVLLQLRVVVSHFETLGRRADPLPVSGGFGNSDAFARRLASTLGCRVAQVDGAEHTTALGAAVVAMLGTGMLASAEEAACWTSSRPAIEPDATAAAGAAARFAVFQASWHDAQVLAQRVRRLGRN